jgi:hypothetical protein
MSLIIACGGCSWFERANGANRQPAAVRTENPACVSRRSWSPRGGGLYVRAEAQEAAGRLTDPRWSSVLPTFGTHLASCRGHVRLGATNQRIVGLEMHSMSPGPFSDSEK